MAWTDPKNKRFLTTGWAMFLVGFFLASVRLGGWGLLGGLQAPMAWVGLLLMGGAVVVWTMKAMEHMQNMYKPAASRTKKPAAKAKSAKTAKPRAKKAKK